MSGAQAMKTILMNVNLEDQPCAHMDKMLLLHVLPNHLTESDHNWVLHFPLQKIIKNVKFSHLFQKLLLLLNLHYLNPNLLKKLLRKQSKRANHQLPNQLKKRNPHLLKIKRSLPKK
jgi:hypothetical protein